MDVILEAIAQHLVWLFERGYRITDSKLWSRDVRRGNVQMSNGSLNVLVIREFEGPPDVSLRSQYWRHDLDLLKFLRYFDYDKELTTRLDATTGEFLKAHIAEIEALVATKELATKFGKELSRRFPTII